MNFSNNVNSISYEYRYPYTAATSAGVVGAFWGPITISFFGGWQYRRWEGYYLITGPAGTLSSTFHLYNNNTLFLNITGNTNDYDSFAFIFRSNFIITGLATNYNIRMS